MDKLRKADIPEHFFRRHVPEDRPVQTRACAHPGCTGVGEYRAPRRREMDDSNPLTAVGGGERVAQWFCLNHIKAFNAQWNFYEGLSVEEMEAAIRFDSMWNRPSWPLGQAGGPAGAAEAKLRKEKPRSAKKPGARAKASGGTAHTAPFVHQRAELEALTELGLEPPTEFLLIKKRYRLLVKQHHPDLQETDETRRTAEEKIKALNSAFTLLKNLYSKA